jgi:hypothetical protein
VVGDNISDEALMAHEDNEHPPDRILIRQVRQAFKGTFQEDITSTDEEPQPGAGGVVNMVANLILTFVGNELKINPDPLTLGEFGTEVLEMFPDVVEEIERFMKADQEFRRPEFSELWTQSLYELLISGCVVAERYFPGFEDFRAVEKAMREDIYEPFLDHPCENVLIRGLEHAIINRSHITGMILDSPFWLKSEISEGDIKEHYNGPLHMNQAVYIPYQRGRMAEHYGMSFFAPVITEIVELGHVYKIAQRIARDNMKPFPIVNVQPGLSDKDFNFILAMLRTFVESQNKGKYENGIALPGGQSFEMFTVKLKYADLVPYLEYLHRTILTWLRIPVTMVLPESNRSVAEVHFKVFNTMISNIRNTLWSGWLSTHFRQLLKEKGLPDWDVTPVIVAFYQDGVPIAVLTDGSQELASVRRNTPEWSHQPEPGAEYYQQFGQTGYEGSEMEMI